MAANVSPERFSFIFRQESLLSAGLNMLLHGMHSLLILYIFYLFWTGTNKRRSYQVLMGLIFLLWVTRTVIIVCEWRITWLAFILNGTTFEHTLQTLLSASGNDATALPRLIAEMMSVVELGVADSIMVWRCWIICDRSWKIALLPLILDVGSIAAGLGVFILGATQADVPQNLGPSLAATSLSLSLGTTVLSTTFIVIRILRVSRLPANRVTTKTSNSTHPQTVVEIMVESAALYAIASLIVIPFEAVASTGTNVRFGTAYAEVVFSAAAALAPALIMLRVALQKREADRTLHSDLEKSTVLKFGVKYNTNQDDTTISSRFDE